MHLPGFGEDASPRERRRVVGVLVVAITAISSAAVLVRLAGNMHPLLIALGRCGLAALLFAPLLRRVSRADLARSALAGVLLAAHFGTWFASLQLTTVMRSTVLVTLAPVWAGLLEWVLLGQPPRRRFWLGLALAIPGVALMSGLDVGGEGSLTGDALALLGGVLGGAYFLTGRVVRRRVGIGTYAFLTAAFAALALLPAVLIVSAPVAGHPWTAWLAVVGLALGPQLLGHNGLNYALRWLPAATVTAITLLEPVGATLLALAVLGEVPPLLGAGGAVLVVGGVLVATVERRLSAS